MMSEIKRRIIIIGGGLGGFALAQFLKDDPFIQASVYERDSSPEHREQGYIIGLNEESIGFLRKGNIEHLDDCLDIYGHSGFVVTDSNMNKLISLEGSPGDRLVNRWDLHNLLSKGLDIHYNKRFERYEENENGVIAYFEDGTFVEGDILVGADGNRSRVRDQLDANLKVDYIDYANTSGSAEMIEDEKFSSLYSMLQKNLVRVLGPQGYTILFLNFKNDKGQSQIVWSLSFPYNKNPSDIPFEDIVDKGYCINEIVGDIIKNSGKVILSIRMRSAQTTNKNVLRKTNKVTLLGDAAHAMTTQRGLGANTAFLDAYDLSVGLKSEDWNEALLKYENILITRGFKAVDDSFNSTKMLHLFGFKAVLRNYMLWSIGKILDWKRWFQSWFK